MRILFSALAFTFAFSASVFCQGKEYSVAFYNLENLFDTINDPKINDEEFLPNGKSEWTTFRYQTKLNNMARAIAAIGDEDGPEIIGLSEVENRRVLEDLVANEYLKPMKYSIVHFDSPDERGIDCALLYKTGFFKPVFSAPIPVQFVDSDDKTRDILYVKGLTGKKDTLHILVNHWPSRRGGAEESAPFRRDVAIENLRILDSLKFVSPAHKLILMGDLNDDPTDESIKKWLGASGNAATKNGLFNPMEGLFLSGQGTLTYKGMWNLFDQIMVSPGLRSGQGMRYVDGSAAVCRADFLVLPDGKSKGHPKRTFSGGHWFEDGFSDHLPVYIHLERK